MRLAFALAAAGLIGTGAFLLLKRDLIRVVMGIVLISQSAALTLIASGLTRGAAPILPVAGAISDPLTQAMLLTALVISLAVTALLLVIVHRVSLAYETVERDEVAREEARRDEQLERESEQRRRREEEEILG